MAKDPAFLFYPGDFNTGTQFFSDEQVGKYMRLLMAQHQHGHLSDNQVLIICKTYDKDVMCKFSKDSEGLWYNERLENEIKKRKNYVESRSKNREGKTKEKNISISYDSHMENENRNKDIIIIGAVSEFFITVRAKYAGTSPKRIYDLGEFFKTTGQLDGLVRAKINRFSDFIKANPSASFEDDAHVYHAFKKFCTKPEMQANGTTVSVYKPGKKLGE